MYKVLFLTSQFPFPTNSGDKIAIVNTAKVLKSLGHEVDLLSLSDTGNSNLDLLNIEPFNDVFIVNKRSRRMVAIIMSFVYGESAVFIRFRSKKFRKKLQEIANNYDIIYSHHNYMAQYFNTVRSKNLLLNDIHVLEYKVFKERSEKTNNRFMRRLLRRESKFLFLSEIEVMKMATLNFTYSELEKAELDNLKNGIRLLLRPLSIDNQNREPLIQINIKQEEKLKLLFFGDHRWFPNYDASKYIITEIAPLLMDDVKYVEITIVGRNIPQDILLLAKPVGNVFIKGESKNIMEELNAHHIVLAPVRIGGGVRLKIIESLSLGKVVITNSVGAEGILDKESVIICENSKAIVSVIKEIRRDPLLLNNYSKKAYQYFRENHSLDSGKAFFINILKQHENIATY